jgi:DNA-binding beta-propeller fold protein YncE
MKWKTNGLLRVAAIAVAAGWLCSQPAPPEHVGKLPDGSFLLPTGWRIKPLGKQVPLDTMPMASVVSPDGRFLLVLNGGYNPPSISVVDTASMEEKNRVPIGDGWLGLCFSKDGRFVYVGGGGSYRVREFAWSSDGTLKPAREFEIAPGVKPGDSDFIGDVAVSNDGRLIYAADLYHDAVLVINPQSGRVTDRFKTGRRPYRILFHPDGKSFFVSSWGDASVTQYSTENGSEIGKVRVGPHATDMVMSSRPPDRDADSGDRDSGAKFRLFVTSENTNSVNVIGVAENKEMKLLETLNVGMTPQHPAGMTPSGVALTADQRTLFVACSDANAVAVADVSEPRSHVRGLLPVGWYPTAVRALADGRLIVLNGRGPGSSPTKYQSSAVRYVPRYTGDRAPGYVGSSQKGSLSVIEPLSEEAMAEATRTAMSLSPYRDPLLDAAAQPDSVVVSKPGKPSPIQHVIYVIKENRTYDQVFGGIGKGNGDPSLTLFDESAGPNHYKLAREFVLFDNFYVNADVSAEGHNWSTAAIAPGFTVRLWPANYAKRSNYYGFEGNEPANTPPAGYLWSNALSAGRTVRNYGEFVTNLKNATGARQVDRVNDPSLTGVTNMNYRGFDDAYMDIDRIKVFLDEFKEFEASGKLPNLTIVRLGNDHTAGTTAGKTAPRSMFADNDYALGQLVEAVSKSRFWSQTAIFVIEDDAQDGPDHVDSHRSPMLALSPYTHHGTIDSTMYNQASVLRTMELILGLRPMTHYDAGARPIVAPFAGAADPRPYTAEKPRIGLNEKNKADAPLAARSARLDFSDADRADENELNEILWRAIKGTDPPVPTRSMFTR